MAADLGFDYEACFTADPTLKKSDIATLRQWIEGPEPSSYIPKDVSDKQLLLFHNACGQIIEDTKKCVKAYYSVRDKDPEHFDDRSMDTAVMKDCTAALEFCVLPEKTNEGYDIVFHRLFDFQPEKYHFNPAVKMLFMTIDRCVYERGPGNGAIFLFDMKGVKLGHLTRVNLSSMSKFFTYIQEGMPAKIKAIHIMNVVPFFDKVMMLMKPFIKKELMSLMNLHLSTVDMEKFYKDVIPKRCLPSDFGGDLPDAQTLHKKNAESLISLKEYFEAEESHRKKYSKRSKKKGMEKGFQDLNID